MAKKKDNEPKTPETKKTEKAKAEGQEKSSELDELTAKLNDSNEKLLRTLAEYDNFRKRSQKEKEQAFGDSKAQVLTELLPVLDNFERAAGNKDASFEDYQKGVDMIFNQFTEILKKLGAESFGETGDDFDPNLHNAVMHIEDENAEDNKVVDVFSKGYKLGDRVLRPAMVKVAN